MHITPNYIYRELGGQSRETSPLLYGQCYMILIWLTCPHDSFWQFPSKKSQNRRGKKVEVARKGIKYFCF